MFSPPPRRLLVAVILTAAGLYLVGNARVSLWDRDEPRYAQTSRQMLQSGDWVVPRFLDKVRTAKPVFIYWCQAAAMSIFGDEGDRGVFAARLPSAVAMTLVLAVVAVAVSRGISREHAFWTVFILATSALVVWSAKACTTDAVLLVGITVAQLCLYAIWRGCATWPVVIVLAVAIAQAGLTKGPVVLGVMGMTLLVLALLRVIDRRWPSPSLGTPGEGWGGGSGDARTNNPLPIPPPKYRGRGKEGTFPGAVLRVVVGLAVIAALVAPWLYLVQQRESKFLGASVGHDVFKRIVQPLEGHTGPPGYQLALIFATFLPWSVLLPMAIVSAWKRRADPHIRFALAAVLGPWVMFELVRTKLPHYMLPAFPPLAFLAADAVVRCLRGEKDDLTRRASLAGVVVIGVVMVALGAMTLYLANRFGDAMTPALVLIAVALVFSVCVVTLFALRQPGRGLLAMGIGMAAFYVALFTLYLPSADALRLSLRAAEMLPDTQAIMLDYKEPSLAFYQGGTIREESALTLSSELVDRAPPWIVVTRETWDNSAEDVRHRVEIVGTARGLAYADGGRTVEVMVLRKR